MLGAARVHASPSRASSDVAVALPTKVVAKADTQAQTQQAPSFTPAVSAPQPAAAAPKAVLRVQLLPLTSASSALVSAAGLNPLLQLNVSGALSVASIMRSVLKQRWASVAGVSGLRLQLPAGAAPVGLQCPAAGWSLEEGRAVTIDALHRSLGMPTPFQLTYTLPGAESSGPAAAATSAVAVSAATRPAPPAGFASASATGSVAATAAAPCPAAPASSSLPSAAIPAVPTAAASMASTAPTSTPASSGSLSPEEMMRLLQNLSPAQAQHIFNSMYGSTNLVTNNLATMPVLQPAYGAAAPTTVSAPSAAVSSSFPSLFSTVPTLVTPTLATRARSVLPPSNFRAFDPVRPPAPHHIPTAPFSAPSAAVPFAPSSAPAARSSKKQKLAHAAPASAFAASVAHQPDAEEQELRHKEAARAARLDALFDDAMPLPMLPTLDGPAAAPAPAPAVVAAHAHSTMQAQMDDLFGPSLSDEQTGAGAMVLPSAPIAPSASAAASAAASSLQPNAPSFVEPFFSTPLRSSSVKKSLFKSFMESSPAAASANGAVAQRNIFPNRAETGSAAASASASASAPCPEASVDPRQALSTLYSSSPASVLNISNNLSSSAPPLSYRVTVSPATSSAPAAPSALSQSVQLPHPTASATFGKENEGLAPPHASSALAALLMNSPSKLAMMGSWQGGVVGGASAAGPKLRPSSSQQLFQQSAAAAAAGAAGSNSHMSTPRGAKGGRASAGGSGGSTGTTSKKKRRDTSGSGGSGSSKRTAAGSGKGSKASKGGKSASSAPSKSDRKRKQSDSKTGSSGKKGTKKEQQRSGKKARRSAADGASNAASQGDDDEADEDVNWDEWAEQLEMELSSDDTETDPSPHSSPNCDSERGVDSPLRAADRDVDSTLSPSSSAASGIGSALLSSGGPGDMELDMGSPLPPVAEASAENSRVEGAFDEEAHAEQQRQLHHLPPSFFAHPEEQEEHAQHPHDHFAAHHWMAPAQHDDGFMGLLGAGAQQQQQQQQPSASPPPPMAIQPLPSSSPPPADLSAPEFALDPRLDQLLQQCAGNVALFMQTPAGSPNQS